jgi:hypothetical protein
LRPVQPLLPSQRWSLTYPAVQCFLAAQGTARISPPRFMSSLLLAVWPARNIPPQSWLMPSFISMPRVCRAPCCMVCSPCTPSATLRADERLAPCPICFRLYALPPNNAPVLLTHVHCPAKVCPAQPPPPQSPLLPFCALLLAPYSLCARPHALPWSPIMR